VTAPFIFHPEKLQTIGTPFLKFYINRGSAVRCRGGSPKILVKKNFLGERKTTGPNRKIKERGSTIEKSEPIPGS